MCLHAMMRSSETACQPARSSRLLARRQASTLSGGTMNDVMKIDDNDHVLGSPDADLTIVEYGDYQCPYTARAHGVLSNLRDELGDRMCLVYRHLPLSQLHPFAEIAAEAAEAAGTQGQFWEMHDALFENQDKLEPEALAVLAESLDLDIKRFRDDMVARRYRARVQADAQRGHADGASGTPTFFITGERYHGDSDEASLTRAVEQALD
jgi:protein-disulfide isomerase